MQTSTSKFVVSLEGRPLGGFVTFADAYSFTKKLYQRLHSQRNIKITAISSEDEQEAA